MKMPGTIFVARLNVPTPKIARFWDTCKSVSGLASFLPGFLGFSVWSDASNPDSYLMVFESEDERCANGTMKALIESPLYDELQKEIEGTSSNRFVNVVAQSGGLISEMPVGSFLSASLRNAEPGRAHELAKDYDLVFENLSFIDGFAGFAYGPSNHVEEQMVGFAWWNTAEAYLASLPPQIFYEIRLFRRISESEMELGLPTS
jgi:heme-degrading monooxygenase HmoA